MMNIRDTRFALPVVELGVRVSLTLNGDILNAGKKGCFYWEGNSLMHPMCAVGYPD